MALKTDAGERRTVTIVEAARMLGIGRNECYKAAKRGELPTVIIGRRILVSRAGLERMIDGARAPRGHGHQEAQE